MHFVSLSALWLATLAWSNASEIRVHHRVVRGHGEAPGFTFRGTVVIDEETNTAHYKHTDSAPLSLGSLGPEHWSFTSTKACFLTLNVVDSIAVVLNDDGIPISLNYDIVGAPPNGACPDSHSHAKHSHSQSPDSQIARFTNTTVSLKRPNHAPLPILKAPPPMTPDGKPVVPPPEKSFIQKYWIYAVPILIILLLAPEEDPGARSPTK